MATRLKRQWLLAARPKGMVKEADFTFREAALPMIQEGQILVRVLFLSFDPAMRGWMNDRPSYIAPVQLGEVMRGAGVGQVIESRNPDFKPGDYVMGLLGWQDYAVLTGGGPLGVRTIPPSGLPLTFWLS